MAFDDLVTGFLENHQNRVEATNKKGDDADLYPGAEYTDNMAVICSTPNGIVMDTGELPPRTLEGYYSIRALFDALDTIDPFVTLAYLDVYQDGELIIWDSGDPVNRYVDGQIHLDYMDQSRTLGSRIDTFFDPKSSYRLKVRTADPLLSPIILDYLEFTKIYHAHPIASWINSSELVGGDLWMFDAGSDTAVFNNVASVNKSITPNYPFKKIEYADCMPIDLGGDFNATLAAEPTGDNVTFSIRNVDGTPSTETLTFKWMILGTVELPIVRPL